MAPLLCRMSWQHFSSSWLRCGQRPRQLRKMIANKNLLERSRKLKQDCKGSFGVVNFTFSAIRCWKKWALEGEGVTNILYRKSIYYLLCNITFNLFRTYIVKVYHIWTFVYILYIAHKFLTNGDIRCFWPIQIGQSCIHVWLWWSVSYELEGRSFSFHFRSQRIRLKRAKGTRNPQRMAYVEVLGVNLKCSTVVSRILPHFSIAFERCMHECVE